MKSEAPRLWTRMLHLDQGLYLAAIRAAERAAAEAMRERCAEAVLTVLDGTGLYMRDQALTNAIHNIERRVRALPLEVDDG